jgi:hypothetical protein
LGAARANALQYAAPGKVQQCVSATTLAHNVPGKPCRPQIHSRRQAPDRSWGLHE